MAVQKTKPAAGRTGTRRRVTRAERQRIVRRRRLGLAGAALLFVLVSVLWQANTPVSRGQMREMGWQNADFGMVWDLNRVLRAYDIENRDSLCMFLATAGAETDGGRLLLEEGGDAYYAAHGYTAHDRGAGYLQLTHRAEHLAFLRAVGDRFEGEDTASYIAEKYPWESAAWEWSVGKTSPAPNPNEYAARMGGAEEVFLATQYGINGWVIDDSALAAIVGGAPYTVSADGTQLTVGGVTYDAPRGWPKRLDWYRRARAVLCGEEIQNDTN